MDRYLPSHGDGCTGDRDVNDLNRSQLLCRSTLRDEPSDRADCGSLIENEVAKAGDPVLADIEVEWPA